MSNFIDVYEAKEGKVEKTFFNSTESTIPYAWNIHGRKISNDRIYRVVSSSVITDPDVLVCETADLRTSLSKVFFEKDRDVSALKSVVIWQRQQLEYQAVCNAHQLGAMTDEEFAEESEQFISDFKTEPLPNLVLDLVDRLERLLEFKLTITDYADLFGVEAHVINDMICGRTLSYTLKLDNSKTDILFPSLGFPFND